MHTTLPEALELWKAADLAAHEGERALAGAWKTFYEGTSGPPSGAVISRTARLRRVASLRLSACLLAISEEARDATTY